MECLEAKKEMISLLYGELEKPLQERLSEHLKRCEECKKEFDDFRRVFECIEQSDPEKWRPIEVTLKKFPSKKGKIPWAWAAVFLLGVGLGYGLSLCVSPGVSRSELLSLAAQNRSYRDSFSDVQWLHVQSMEKKLAEVSRSSELVAQLHALDSLEKRGSLLECLQQEEAFLKKYPETPLAMPVRMKLAQKLVSLRQYRRAIETYQTLLQAVSLVPHDRGELMLRLAFCYKEEGQMIRYRELLEQIERGSFPGDFQGQAIKALAEEDFRDFNFHLARVRYQKYLEHGREEEGEIRQRMHWIEFHEKDNFYPLILFVQAREKGAEHYYGLRIILERYPDSPLAFLSMAMYLKNREFYSAHQDIPDFPAQQTPEKLLPYLQDIAELKEYKEVAAFARYWQGLLLEKMEKISNALEIYRKVVEENQGEPLGKVAHSKIMALTPKRRSL